jgi:hypothetical protein
LSNGCHADGAMVEFDKSREALMVENCGILDTGQLGIFHLKRIWKKSQATLCGVQLPELVPQESQLDRAVLDSIGLGIVEPNQYLFHGKPTFSEFEAWITDKLGSAPSPHTVATTNRVVEGLLFGNFRTFPASETIHNPVLGPDDMACWEDRGYVILKQAISRSDAQATEQMVWDFLGFAPDQQQAWYQRGQVFWVDLFQHPLLIRNRASPRIKKAFAQLWGTEDLIANVDRVSFNPPVQHGIDHSGPSRLHWDTSLALPIPFDVLGILYLNDVAHNQGAFRCIPGFHRSIASWLSELPAGANPRDENFEDAGVVSLAGSAGDMVIWRQELPHGSGRNLADVPRIAQYITLYPPDRGVNPVWR